MKVRIWSIFFEYIGKFSLVEINSRGMVREDIKVRLRLY